MPSVAFVTGDWRTETARVAASYDTIADLYRRQFADELERKPFDRDLLSRVAGRFTAGRPVLEVGAGPGHVAAYLAQHGVAGVVSDVSLGQLREARVLDPARGLVASDLARLPVRPGSLAGVVAFYCLIFGAAEHLDEVFADWYRALGPGGLAVVAVHAGRRTTHVDEWQGRAVDLTFVLRDPDDLAARVEQAGFAVEEQTVRPPYEDEHPTDRCYLVATRS